MLIRETVAVYCKSLKGTHKYIVWAECRIVEPKETSIARQRLGKQVFTETDTQATIRKFLGTIFSVRSVRSGNKRRELVNWCSVFSTEKMLRKDYYRKGSVEKMSCRGSQGVDASVI
jgi:hypothetical protein